MADSRLEIILAAKDISGRALTGFQNRLARLTRGLFSFRGVLGGVLGAGGLGVLIEQSISAADAIGKTADKVGISTDALQELQFAASQSGVATNTLNMAMQRFSRRVGEAAIGKGELLGVLRDYNIAVTDSAGRLRSQTDVLGDLAEVIKNTRDPQERLRIAFKAFDSEGAALVNMLKDGRRGLVEYSDEARRLGLVIDEDMIRKAEDATDELDKLTRAIRTRFTKAVVDNADAIYDIADAMTAVLEKASAFSGFINAFSGSAARHQLTEIAGAKIGTPEYKEIGKLSDEEAIKRLAAFYGSGVSTRDQIRLGKTAPPGVETGAATGGGGGVDIGALKSMEEAKKQAAKYTKQFEQAKKETTFLEIALEKAAKKAREMAEAEAEAALQQADFNEKVAEMNGLVGGSTWEMMQKQLEDMEKSSERTGEAITNHIGYAFADVITNIEDAGEAFAGFGRSVLNFIAQLLAQQAAEGIVGGVAGAIASLFHKGGRVDGSGAARSVPAAMFIGAPRLHGGLAPDEYPAILQRGETVIPKDQGGAPTYHFHIMAADAQSFVQMVNRNPGAITAVVQRDIAGNGSLRSTIQRNL